MLAKQSKSLTTSSYLMTHIPNFNGARNVEQSETRSSQWPLCVESITTVPREQEKEKNYAIFISTTKKNQREMYEQKQKAIICVLVGEQQFCKIFLLRERRWNRDCFLLVPANICQPSFCARKTNVWSAN